MLQWASCSWLQERLWKWRIWQRWEASWGCTQWRSLWGSSSMACLSCHCSTSWWPRRIPTASLLVCFRRSLLLWEPHQGKSHPLCSSNAGANDFDSFFSVSYPVCLKACFMCCWLAPVNDVAYLPLHTAALPPCPSPSTVLRTTTVWINEWRASYSPWVLQSTWTALPFMRLWQPSLLLKSMTWILTLARFSPSGNP